MQTTCLGQERRWPRQQLKRDLVEVLSEESLEARGVFKVPFGREELFSSGDLICYSLEAKAKSDSFVMLPRILSVTPAGLRCFLHSPRRVGGLE